MPAMPFEDDLHWILRTNKGFGAWFHSEEAQRRMAKRLWRRSRHLRMPHPFYWDYGLQPLQPLRSSLKSGFLEHELLDLVLKALMRAEVRLSTRFIPQRSHEERLTGNLVSEIDAATFYIKPAFEKVSEQLYRQNATVDFCYYDLSQGGPLEKRTGADLAFLVYVDLPDLPQRAATVRIQAKKIVGGSAQLELPQYKTLTSHGFDDSVYLFYDMDYRTLCAPLVLESKALSSSADQAEEKGNASFTVKYEGALGGMPLSLYLLMLADGSIEPQMHSSFNEAWRSLREHTGRNLEEPPNGRAAILSIGKPIQLTSGDEGGLSVSVE